MTTNVLPLHSAESLEDRYRSALYSFDQLQTLPQPSWLIDNVLPADALAVLSGESTAGKTFLALDWALSLATGTSWAYQNLIKIPVLYIAAEGARGMTKRANAWAESRGRRPIDEEILFLARSVNMLDEESLLILRTIAKEQQSRLLIFDTLGRSLGGASENDTGEMGKLIEATDELRRELNATILFVHHPSKSGGMRGSGRFKNDVDAVYELGINVENDPKSDRTLYCRKQKDSAPFYEMTVKLQKSGPSLVPFIPYRDTSQMEAF